MNQIKGIIMLAVAIILISQIGCASSEAVWKTIPEVKQVKYEDAWAIVVGCVSDKFDLEITDAGSGYLRTAWKVTGKTLIGQPNEKTRITVRIVNRQPLQINLRAERQTPNIWSGEWQDSGNNEKIEKQILEELSSRLK
jgi:hypothetical protein